MTDRKPAPYRKKLIEVALPLDAINAASAREKSIRHGHPSTLHLWWARRPLAACRAVLFASLVDDPDADPRFADDPDAAATKRGELFNLLTDLVQWENSNNPRVINRARFEIARCLASRLIETGQLQRDTIVFDPDGQAEGQPHPVGPVPPADDPRVTAGRMAFHADLDFGARPKPEAVNHFLANHAPPVLDPFAGGGSIPLEAQRLGLRAHASDLNPVAVLINKALIEIPPKFADLPPVHPDVDQKTGWSGAEGLAEDVRRYGRWMRDEAERRIGHLYPKVKITADMAEDRPDLKPYVGQELTVIAWLWARTVPSPDPALHGKHVPLVRSFWLSKKKGKEAYVEPIVDKAKGEFTFKVRIGKPAGFDPDDGTVERRGDRCLISGTTMPFKHIRSEGRAGRMDERLMAIVAEGNRGRVYLDPIASHAEVAGQAEPDWEPTAELPDNPRDFKTPTYGMNTFGDLFTDRQLTALVTFSDLVGEARARVLADAERADRLPDDPRPLHQQGQGPPAYADAVATYLAFAIDKLADLGNTGCPWEPVAQCPRNLFGRQALPMHWNFAEANPMSENSGSMAVMVDNAARNIEAVFAKFPATPTGDAFQADAMNFPIVGSPPVVSTDPPYYDNIGYADLSDF